MSDITTINGDDIIKDSRAVINANFEALNTDKVETLADLGVNGTVDEVNEAVENRPTDNQKAALAGGGEFGTPSSTNMFLTEEWNTANPPSFTQQAPIVESTVNTTASSSTTHALSIPSGVVAGEIVVFFIRASIGVTANSVTNSYTIALNSGGNIVLWKLANGTDTTTLTLSGSSDIAYVGYRVSNIYGSLSITNIITRTDATSNNDPSALEPTFGIRNYLWLYGYFWNNTGTVTDNPTNYTDLLTNAVGAGADRKNIASGRRTFRSIHENPDALPTSGTHSDPRSVLIAIRPSPNEFD